MLSVDTVTDQGMDVRVGDLIVGTGAIGTGKALGRNALRGAAPAFAFAPGRHGDAGRRMVGGGRSRLPTHWAIRGRAEREEPLSGGGDGGRPVVRPHLRPVPE
jgi:hypothetical protein